VLLTIAEPGPWKPWGLFGLSKVITDQPTECVICRTVKETTTCTVKGYRETGQKTPVLKVEVCKECLG
jgi:hypothetical protein